MMNQSNGFRQGSAPQQRNVSPMSRNFSPNQRLPPQQNIVQPKKQLPIAAIKAANYLTPSPSRPNNQLPVALPVPIPVAVAPVGATDTRDGDNLRQKCQNLEEQIKVYSKIYSGPLNKDQIAIKYHLLEIEYEKLCSMTNKVSHENELLLHKNKQLQLENVKLEGITLNQSYLEQEIVELKKENQNLSKQQDIYNQYQAKVQIEVDQKQERIDQLEQQIQQIRLDYQVKFNQMELSTQQQLALQKVYLINKKQQNLGVVLEQVNPQQDYLNKQKTEQMANEIKQLKLEKENLSLQLTQSKLKQDSQAKDIVQQTQASNQDSQQYKSLLNQQQETNQRLQAQLKQTEDDLKKQKNEQAAYKEKKEQEIQKQKTAFNDMKSHDELKINMLIKEHETLTAAMKNSEAQNQLKLQEVENYNREERKKLEKNNMSSSKNQQPTSPKNGANETKVQLLLEELNIMNQQQKALQGENDNLKKKNQNELNKLRKDNELWIVNAQEEKKEKDDQKKQLEQEYIAKVSQIKSRYDQQLAKMKDEKAI